MIRGYLLKGTDLSDASQKKLDEIALSINTRPRKILGFRTPQEVYFEELENINLNHGVALGV